MKKGLRKLIIFLAGVSLATQPVMAAEELKVSNKYVLNDTLYVYVENPDEFEEVTCQIGQEYSGEVSVKKITEPEISVDTYLLIDNSLSVQEKYRNTMKQVAKNIVLTGNDNEQFTIATFDTEIHYLAEDSDSSEALIQSIDQIAFQDQETNVFDVLYRLYEKMEQEDSESFKRIIFMSDGMETVKSGYTREELLEKAEENAYPVYVLGCTYNSNEAELESMFRISRETNAEYYHLDKVGSAEQIVAGINDSFDYVQVQVSIPEAQQDGALKGVKLVFSGAEGEKTGTFSYEMPFYNINTEAKSETDENLTQENETEVDSYGEPEEKSSQIVEKIFTYMSDTKIILPVVGTLAGVVILVIVLVIIKKKKSKKKVKKQNQKVVKEETSGTEFLGEDRTEMLDDDVTGMADVITIRLFDTKRPSQIKEYSLESSVTIGRSSAKCQIVFDYEKSISSEHCEIYRLNDRIYIRDLHSANGTYVDGMMVEDNMELENGSIIKLGRLQIEFQMV